MLSFAIALIVLFAALVVVLAVLPASRPSALRTASVWVAAVAAVTLAAMSVIVAFSTAPPTPVDGGSGTAEQEQQGREAIAQPSESNHLPAGFSYVRDFAPGIEVQLRYATTDNFTGQIVDGYESTDAAIMRTEAAQALALVQEDLESAGYGLLIYDAFRPTRAVSFFVDWSNSADVSTMAEYYPGLEKPGLFQLGYIAEKSGHSLGGTVDVTLVDQRSGEPLDMGGAFDFFGEISHYDAAGLSEAQMENRRLLHDAMAAHGFAQYPLEWWHYSFTLGDNPIPENFVVR
ncbi:M15 family metallopeptidase [Leucobacter sp. UT-8R-CII-1-4]|uniref:M15 family metallopeptidase n=1 Tax=Leucobacter sp. UT-8R-CII-1-4 TaxID=3040075 RepID=UPI0024A806E5|nr:M15 family metallopeptidase [Leucobacter sp. UT-8R-CII-1-4]MDI6022892.1 M15 family metallopeptidase [Leucobacter sp. UT-8R-CII-1-4]